MVSSPDSAKVGHLTHYKEFWRHPATTFMNIFKKNLHILVNLEKPYKFSPGRFFDRGTLKALYGLGAPSSAEKVLSPKRSERTFGAAPRRNGGV